MINETNLKRWIAHSAVFLAVSLAIAIHIGWLGFVGEHTKLDIMLGTILVLLSVLVEYAFSLEGTIRTTITKEFFGKNKLSYYNDGSFFERWKNLIKSSEYKEITIIGTLPINYKEDIGLLIHIV